MIINHLSRNKSIVLLFSCKKDEVPAPIADFTIINNNCIAPCELQFSNLSQNASSYNWNFGDGTSSVEENPKHLYQDWGTYSVTLIAINTDGEDLITKEVMVIDTTGSSGSRIISLNGDLSFGNVQINPSSPPSMSFSIMNNGNLTLNVTEISLPEGFNSDFDNPISIDPQSELFVEVTFNPTEEKDYSGNITVTSNATSGGNTITASGAGVIDNSSDCPAEFIDPRDGQTYKAVFFASQCWMKENLRYDSPSSGADIPSENNPVNLQTSGMFYPWDVAMNGALSSNYIPSGVQGVCPPGWHLPSMSEWQIIFNHYGNEELAYQGLVEGGTSGIDFNLSGYGDNSLNWFSEDGLYWTTRQLNLSLAYFTRLDESKGKMEFDGDMKTHKLPCRCIKD